MYLLLRNDEIGPCAMLFEVPVGKVREPSPNISLTRAPTHPLIICSESDSPRRPGHGTASRLSGFSNPNKDADPDIPHLGTKGLPGRYPMDRIFLRLCAEVLERGVRKASITVRAWASSGTEPDR